jgi:hypothetical protein
LLHQFKSNNEHDSCVVFFSFQLYVERYKLECDVKYVIYANKEKTHNFNLIFLLGYDLLPQVLFGVWRLWFLSMADRDMHGSLFFPFIRYFCTSKRF